ncbi:MAG: YkgJ family cysteine cluster protein [Phycisphaerales bacterium]
MSNEERNEEWYADGLRFTCTQCGNCCTGPTGYVWFNEAELGGMAKFAGISEKEFVRRHARKIGGRFSLNERKTSHGHDCVFLQRDDAGKAGCTIYSVRPRQCRTWPFWPENLTTRKAYERAGARCSGMTRGLAGEGNFVPVELIRIVRDSAGG